MDFQEAAQKTLENLKNFVSKEVKAQSDSIELKINESLDNAIASIDKAIKEIPIPRDGVDGKDGIDGKDGQNGKDADYIEIFKYIDERIAKEVAAITLPADGRDALDLDILPVIVPEKTYDRGSYATHNGGLWRASSMTKGMNGWDCIIDGLSDVSIDYDGERTFTINAVKASGNTETKSFKLPVVLDKGVYRDGHAYEKGDCVSFAGSSWIAQKDISGVKPGLNDDWRLHVKRGRNAKEAVSL